MMCSAFVDVVSWRHCVSKEKVVFLSSVALPLPFAPLPLPGAGPCPAVSALPSPPATVAALPSLPATASGNVAKKKTGAIH
jgi:hypothetical protein